MWVNTPFYTNMFIFAKMILNGKVHFFVHWFMQVNKQKTTVKKKIAYFSKIMLLLYSQFLKRFLQFAIFFTTRCLDVRFWDLLYFIHLMFNPQYWYLLLHFVDLVVIFNKGREETFAVSLWNCKSCVCIKYLTLVQPRRLIAMNFTFFIHNLKCTQFFFFILNLKCL